MRIIYAKSFDSAYKNLKKHYKEKNELDEIIRLILHFNTFSEMIKDPLINMYHFERLKYELNEFYSFRLSKVYRLIVRPRENDVEIELVYISVDHYTDFYKDKVRI